MGKENMSLYASTNFSTFFCNLERPCAEVVHPITKLVITQVVGWEKPYPTTNLWKLGGNLPIVTLGKCPHHFRGEVVTSRRESW
jgi:hypothetical protein